MRKLCLILLCCSLSVFADETTPKNRGPIDNLCQNLTNACQGGDESSCQAAKDTGCLCDPTTGTCTRGNYSN